MTVAEFRTKWYGEAPDVAEERAGKLGAQLRFQQEPKREAEFNRRCLLNPK